MEKKKDYICKHKKHGFPDCSDCRLDRTFGTQRADRKEPRDVTFDISRKEGKKLVDVEKWGGYGEYDEDD